MQRNIDGTPEIDVGMFELDLDCGMGVGLDHLEETRLLPARGLFGGIKLSSLA